MMEKNSTSKLPSSPMSEGLSQVGYGSYVTCRCDWFFWIKAINMDNTLPVVEHQDHYLVTN